MKIVINTKIINQTFFRFPDKYETESIKLTNTCQIYL